VHIGRYFGDLVAIKKQVREQQDLDEYLRRELAVLKNIKHPNLVAYIGAWNEASEKELSKQNVLYIVTEFCQVYIAFVMILG
jgi:serine/threonine protein kinase